MAERRTGPTPPAVCGLTGPRPCADRHRCPATRAILPSKIDVHTITSRQNPLVALCRAIARGRDEGRILLDGPHLVEEALAAGLSVTDATFTAAALETPETRSLAERLGGSGTAVHAVSDQVMHALSPVASPAGVVAVAMRPATTLAAVFDPAPQLVLVGAGIQEPGNVGAMVRSGEAGGATGLVFTAGSADPFAWKALRGSTGSAFRVPVAIQPDAAAVIREARARALRIVATAPRGARSMYDADLRRPLALLVGAEGPGLPAGLIEAADETVAIPMRAPVESLNVAVACALLVYEAARQREG
jgi:TrmH family RNA methyltransferase